MGNTEPTKCGGLTLFFRDHRPSDRLSLQGWIAGLLDMEMPETALCPGHSTPLDYLCHSFFEEEGDAVVWACRGGGKTMVGAVATLLDLLFKPGIQVRILGGSFEQSERMYRYLIALVQTHFSHQLKAPPTQRRLEFRNGSRVEVLAQSDRSVRGQRVQKLRCDEVELFDDGVWQAAQLVTRGTEMKMPVPRHRVPYLERVAVRGSVEAFSTMHKPAGLMGNILENSEKTGRKIFSWCVWDVLEWCGDDRQCATCPLWDECRGRAKVARDGGNGFVLIEDVIAMKSRVSMATWEHEMLCHRPRLERAVFPAFRRETHVRSAAGIGLLPGNAITVDGRTFRVEGVFAGVDFGYRGAFVCLWMAMLREGTGEKALRTVWVVDEMIVREETLPRNIRAMRARSWEVVRVYCDVAGRGPNSQTGLTDERLLREAGFLVTSKAMPIGRGLAMIADLVNPAVGPPRLFIDPKCAHLIAAMESYERGKDGSPVKDGTHDHPIDALRYALANHDGSFNEKYRLY